MKHPDQTKTSSRLCFKCFCSISEVSWRTFCDARGCQWTNRLQSRPFLERAVTLYPKTVSRRLNRVVSRRDDHPSATPGISPSPKQPGVEIENSRRMKIKSLLPSSHRRTEPQWTHLTPLGSGGVQGRAGAKPGSAILRRTSVWRVGGQSGDVHMFAEMRS